LFIEFVDFFIIWFRLIFGSSA